MKTDKEILCKSHNSKAVWYNPKTSHTATHFDDTPNLKALTTEILTEQVLSAEKIDLDVEMKRIIGTCDLVETDESDEKVFAVRKNRHEQGRIPFTKSRKPTDCSTLSLHLFISDDGTYELVSAWIGTDESPPFPEDKSATAESKSYWNIHAFVWGSQEIIAGTELTKCPW